MIIDVLKSAILANAGVLKQAPNGWMKRNCMLCYSQGQSQDTRSRFGILTEPNSIIVHCFNCSFSASYIEGQVLSKKFKFFLNKIGVNETLIKEIEFEIFKNKNDIISIREGVIEYDIESKFKALINKWEEVELPDGALSLAKCIDTGVKDPQFIQAVDYLFSRKIYDLTAFYWTPSTLHNLNERVIIPYYYKKKIVGFTSRLSYNSYNKLVPKYYQKIPKGYVYNLDAQQDWVRKYVIVNEGVLDAWVTDGVSSLGSISQPQIDIINQLQKTVIVCPDRDKSGYVLVKAAIDNGWKVSFPKWAPGIKDASDAAKKYGRILTVHSILESAVEGEVSIDIEWKIGHAERERRSR